jgi:site-specific recombinase XerD
MSVTAARQLAKTDLSPAALAYLAIGKLEDQDSMALVSQLRVSDLIQGFAGFLHAAGIARAEDIAPLHVDAFVHSLTRGGAEPSLATMHLRRSALRIFFKEAKALGFTNNDPSTDIELPPRTYRHLRPLTNEEIDRCRSFAAGWLASQPMSPLGRSPKPAQGFPNWAKSRPTTVTWVSDEYGSPDVPALSHAGPA